MSPEDVARLADAIALANGHAEAGEWSTKVVDAWKAIAPANTLSDLKKTIAESRAEEK
jgi:hypothetical protein